MTVLATLLTWSVIASTTFAAQSTCQTQFNCPCGSTGTNVTVCIQSMSRENESCRKLSRCKTCQDGLHRCLECPDGFEGPLCSVVTRQKVKSRQKRQFYYSVHGRRPSFQRRGNRPMQSQYQARAAGQYYCSDLDSPKLGSIRCISNDQQRTCVGRCLPGYNFENHESEEEITLTCRGGNWAPLSVFPPCKTGGHCDLIVQGAGSFNCTTGMTGTRCDVNCANRYIGRYYCYPGRPWDPSLPYCVRPKEVPRSGEDRQSCRCEYGASCDNRGSCVCPAGRTGTFCEILVPEKQTCSDPGFVSNGFRRNTDSSESNTRRTFEEGESVVYGCTSEEFALQGSSLLTCKNDGTWSSPLPKCITSRVTPERTEVTCPDPGQIANADRLNSDGSPSVGVQRYRVGQSVVYTCNPGFALQRRSLISCLASGAWSSRTPHCTRVTPPSPLIRTTTESTAVLRYCRDPGVDPNGSREPRLPPNRRRFPQGSFLQFSCNEGYDLVGERGLFCLDSGVWSASRPSCEAKSRTPDRRDDTELSYCPNPGSIANGQVVYYPDINNRKRVTPEEDDPDLEYPEGSRLQYSCNRGYSLEGSELIICDDSGFWSAEPPTCKRESTGLGYCQNPGSVSNGRVVYVPSLNERRSKPPDPSNDMEVEYPQGGRLQYSCNSGYSLEGSAALTCEASGSWSADPPKCVSVSGTNIMYCSNPGSILNGKVKYFPPGASPRTGPGRFSDDDLEYPEGTRLEYSCDDGYKLDDTVNQLTATYSLICQSTGYWSSDPPACVGDCGRSFMQTTRRILHGDKTIAGEWPWVVAISIQEKDVTRLICGGAVLNSRTILTAAHCLQGSDKFTLYFGKLHRRNKDDDMEVLVRRSTRIIIHPDYTNTTIDSDIGLVMFEPRIRYSVRVQPICLPTAKSTARNLMTGKIGYVTGWGLTERNLQAEEMLLASLPILTNEACLESYRKQNIILPLTRNMFCAGFENSQQSVCEGDSGSPLVFYDSTTEKYTVEGLVSFGVEGQCGLAGRYTVFTKVFRFLPWILRNL